MTAQLSSYDDVPYLTRPRYSTHPDCLATMAVLAGMQPASVAGCRVLELGCGPGGNLLPLADAFPDSDFVGVDLSARQIQMGQELCAGLELTNLRLVAASILDVDETFGNFDYVICHGVYSWVPAEVRTGILRVCQGRLKPHGVAMISYNTYPGWHLRGPVGEMLRFHVRDIKDAQARAEASRRFLAFVASSVARTDSTWARLVREESERLGKESDFYLVHEHLDDVSHAVYFREFATHAREHRLQYLGEASVQPGLAAFPPEVQKTLGAAANDPIALEQYLDFLTCRSFRRTLVVRDDIVLERAPRPVILNQLLLVSLARPVSERVDVCSSTPTQFRNDRDVTASTNVPATKAALMTLFEAAPQAIPFEQLWQQTRARLLAGSVNIPDTAREELANYFVQLFRAGLVGLHTTMPAFVMEPGQRPRATRFARLQASQGVPVVNRCHRSVEMPGFDRALLCLLDGHQDRQALLQGLVNLVQKGDFELARDGQPVTETVDLMAILGGELEGALQRLAKLALLVS
jgi:methyltransferase-like protein/2-polyprenyl-3-methyl-5-hydroxy-6-metoxy-1,4-benzoquinol methylase